MVAKYDNARYRLKQPVILPEGSVGEKTPSGNLQFDASNNDLAGSLILSLADALALGIVERVED